MIIVLGILSDLGFIRFYCLCRFKVLFSGLFLKLVGVIFGFILLLFVILLVSEYIKLED